MSGTRRQQQQQQGQQVVEVRSRFFQQGLVGQASSSTTSGAGLQPQHARNLLKSETTSPPSVSAKRELDDDGDDPTAELDSAATTKAQLLSPSPPPRSARGSASSSNDTKSPMRRKRLKRGYASPETYAHLAPLSDCLAEELDVLFCGINPGYESARSGFHYAHPTNHFWPCLHLSGLTPRRLSPSDGHVLPQLYNIGLTNLVTRPSAEAAELLPSEYIDSVPALMLKLRRYRPRVVCFVGKVVWDAVEKFSKKHSSMYGQTRQSSPKKGGTLAMMKWGVQPYKLLHENGAVPQTLFYVVPSTSARVVSHQLPDKAKLFSALKSMVEGVKADELDCTEFYAIDEPCISLEQPSRE